MGGSEPKPLPKINLTVTPEAVEALAREVTQRVLAQLALPPPRRWGTVREAAQQTGLTEAAVRHHIARGHLHSRTVGGRILVDLGALEDGVDAPSS